MSENTFNALLVDADRNTIAKVIVQRGEKNNFAELINCDVFDIAEYTINGQKFDFICDDEGLYSGKHATVIDRNNNPILIGSVLICRSKSTDDGIIESDLLPSDLTLLRDKICIAKFPDGKLSPVIKVDEVLI